MKNKKVSAKERLELYENFFARLHFLRHVAGNERRVLEMLSISDAVTMSASTHDANGRPLTEEQIAQNESAAFERMRNLP